MLGDAYLLPEVYVEIKVLASASVLVIGSPPLRLCYLGSDGVHFASAGGCVLASTSVSASGSIFASGSTFTSARG